MQHLPTHPFTGLQAVYVDKYGRPRYPIMGGADDGDGDSGGSGDQGGDDASSGDGGDAGDGNKDAENRMLIDERTGRKSAEALLAELTGKSKLEIRRLLKDPTKAREALTTKPDEGKGGDKPEVDEAAIRTNAQREADERANVRIVRAEVRALAAETFADPADAPLYVDLSDFEVDDDGEVNTAEIKKALGDVLKVKPHLAKRSAGPKPDPSQGPRGDKQPDPGPGMARLRHAYANTSK